MSRKRYIISRTVEDALIMLQVARMQDAGIVVSDALARWAVPQP